MFCQESSLICYGLPHDFVCDERFMCWYDGPTFAWESLILLYWCLMRCCESALVQKVALLVRKLYAWYERRVLCCERRVTNCLKLLRFDPDILHCCENRSCCLETWCKTDCVYEIQTAGVYNKYNWLFVTNTTDCVSQNNWIFVKIITDCV